MTAREKATKYLTEKYQPTKLIEWDLVVPYLHSVFETADGIMMTAMLSERGVLSVYALVEHVENVQEEWENHNKKE